MWKIARKVVGVAVIIISLILLIQGGFTRAAIQHAFPWHPVWSIIAVGLLLLGCGMFLVRPGFFHRGKTE